MKSICLLLAAAVTIDIESVDAFVVPSGRTRTVLTKRPSLFLHQTTNIDKDVYKPDKIEDVEYDTIVIGSGIGGLSAASLLAQKGQKVLVLEQHYMAGGSCHTFMSKGYRFATGIHYVGCMHDEDRIKQLLDSLTPVDDPVIWDRMDDHFETVVLGDSSSSFEIVAGEENLKKSLKERFPTKKKAIEKYFKLVRKTRAMYERVIIFKSLPLPLMRLLTRTGLHRFLDNDFRKLSKKTVQEGLEELTDDKDLQAVLAYNWGDYGVEPNRAPFVTQLLCASHFLDGAYYPRDGPSMIPRKVIQKINDCGGKVLVSASVRHILVDDKSKRVTGVEMMDGHLIKSKNVVSDAGLIDTVTKLLPSGLIKLDLAKDESATFGKLHPGISATSLFVGLKGDSRALNLPTSQYWIYSSNEMSESVEKMKSMTLEEVLAMKPEELSPIFVGNPSSKDQAWAERHPNKSVLEVFTLGPQWKRFEKYASFYDKKTRSHGPEYESVKLRLGEKMWERVVEVLGAAGAKLPKTLGEVDHFEIGTPLTFAYYLGHEKGAFYGLDHSKERYAPQNFYLRLRPEVPEVPGLYLTGQDVLVDSFAGAMIGGMLCAQKVLGIMNPLSLIHKSKENAQELPRVSDIDKSSLAGTAGMA